MTSLTTVLELMILRARELGSPAYDVSLLSDAINEVFVVYGSEDIADLVRNLARKHEISLSDGSNILRVSVWSGSENGTGLLAHLDEWLRTARDSDEVALALSQDTYPFEDAEEMRSVLKRVMRDFPEHGPRCAALIQSRPKPRS